MSFRAIRLIKLAFIGVGVIVLLWAPESIARIVSSPEAIQLATVRIDEAEITTGKIRSYKSSKSGLKIRGIKKKTKKKVNKNWRMVTGYRGKEYVYGEIQSIGRQEFNGYVFRQNKDRIYIYGTLGSERIVGYDYHGNVYQLTYQTNY